MKPWSLVNNFDCTIQLFSIPQGILVSLAENLRLHLNRSER